MKRLSFLASSVLALALLFGACGGGNNDEDARRGKIEAASAQGKQADKDDKVPAGVEPTKVGAPASTNDCGTAFELNWVENPKNLKDAAGKSKHVIEGEIVDVQPAADLVVPAEGEPNGEYRIPTQEITVKVLKAHKGGAAAGETLTMFQTGSVCRQVAGDPAYNKGEKHLLLLTDGPDGKQRTVSPEGRFKQQSDGTLEPTTHGPVADEGKGKKVKDIEDKLK